jgi:hypothetical protein
VLVQKAPAHSTAQQSNSQQGTIIVLTAAVQTCPGSDFGKQAYVSVIWGSLLRMLTAQTGTVTWQARFVAPQP